MSAITVCPIDPLSKDWRRLVDRAAQQTIYLQTEWLALHDVKIYAAYKGTDIHGAVVVAPTSYPLPYVPYQGIVQRYKEDWDVADALIAEAEEVGRPVSVWNAPPMVDVRPFAWRWWNERKVMWSPCIRYTYFCYPDTRLENRHRALITDAPVVEEDRFDWFEQWKAQPWVGPMDAEMMDKILGLATVRVYTDYKAWVVWGVDMQDRGYYLASVGEPTNVIYWLIRQHASTDLVGANSRERALYKRGFGGVLKTGYGMVAV